MADQTIDKVQVEISATANSSIKVVDDLVQKLTSLKTALSAIDTSKLQSATKASKAVSVDTSGMTKAEKDITKSINNIKIAMAGLDAYKKAGLLGDGSSLISASRNITKVQSEIDKLGETLKLSESTRAGVNIGSDSLQGFRTELAEIQSALTDTKGVVDSAIKDMNAKKIKINTKKSEDNAESLSKKIKKVSGNLLVLSGQSISNGFKNIKSGFGNIKNTISDIGGRISKFANTGLMKILRYGFGIRSLYVLFRRLKEAVKDSFGALQSSGAMFETTRANIEALKNSLQTLKFQFGAAFEPIFNAIAPALQTLIDYLVTVMNVISAFIAKLMGRSSYSKVSAVLTKTGSAAGGAAKSVKELNHQLQGFDELNNLTLDPGNSGGGGGGGGGGAGGAMYEAADVDSVLGDFAEELAENIRAGKWFEVGEAISQKLTEVMENIPWDNIFQKAANFGKNFADFLNGLITDDLFYQLGRTIANAIKTPLIAALSFGSNFEWKELGSAVASGIIGFVDQNPLQLVAENFDVWANGILDALITALDKLQEDGTFEKIGDHLANAINTIDIPEKLWKLAKVAKSLLKGIATAITEMWDDLELQNQIGLAIVGMVAVARLTGLSDVLVAALGRALVGKTLTLQQTLAVKIAGIALVIGGLALADSTLGEGGLNGLAEGLIFKALGAGITLAGLKMMGLNIGLSLKITAVILAAGVGWEIGKAVSQWIAEKISGTDGISAEAVDEYIEISKTMTFKGVVSDVALAAKQGNLWDAWSNMINDWFAPIYEILDPKIMDAIAKFKEGFRKIKEGIQETLKAFNPFATSMPDGKKIVDGLVQGMRLALSTNPFTAPFVKIFDAVKAAFANKFKSNSPARAMYPLGENILTGIIEGFKQGIRKFVPDALLELYDAFTQNNEDGSLTKTQQTTGSLLGLFNPVLGFGYNLFNNGKTTYTATLNTKMTGSVKSTSQMKELGTNWENFSLSYKDKDADLVTSMLGAFLGTGDIRQAGEYFRALDRDYRSKNVTYTTNMGGQITSRDQIDKARIEYEKLYNAWESRSSTLSTSTGGQFKTISDADAWLTKYSNLYNKWLSRSATLSASTGGQFKNINDADTWGGKIKGLLDKWVSKALTMTANFNQSQSTIQGYADQMDKLSKSWTSKSASFTLNASFNTTDINKIADYLTDRIRKGLNGSFRVNVAKAMGGIFSGGAWHNIPQYAGGTLNAGSMFVAGEAGPEIVGNINGRTEVLNRSQIASTIYSATVKGMSQFRNVKMTQPSDITQGYSAYSTYATQTAREMSTNTQAILEQNKLLQEQNDLLRDIANKDVTISSREVFNATRSEADNYYKRTGNSAFLY